MAMEVVVVVVEVVVIVVEVVIVVVVSKLICPLSKQIHSEQFPEICKQDSRSKLHDFLWTLAFISRSKIVNKLMKLLTFNNCF